jgi:hypothetical protein
MHQKASLRLKTGTDAYGQPELTSIGDMIDCRIEKRLTTTKDNLGRELTSTIVCYMEPVNGVTAAEDLIGGTINGMDILSVKEMVSADGKVIGFEVSL